MRAGEAGLGLIGRGHERAITTQLMSHQAEFEFFFHQPQCLPPMDAERETAIAGRFREAREDRELSQASLGHTLGLTRDQVANIESGRAVLRYDIGEKFCAFLGVSQRWLATGAEPDFPFVRLYEDLQIRVGYVPEVAFSSVYDLSLAGHCNAFFEGNIDTVLRQIRLVSYARPEGQRGSGSLDQESAVLWRAIHDLFHISSRCCRHNFTA